MTGRNIVVCLDGTGNRFKEENSNIVKLFQVLVRNRDDQLTYYDAGVGTMGDPAFRTKAWRRFTKVAGMAFGYGLQKNLEEAYSFLMDNYVEGDRLYIFGFSRGAYTARALGSFISRCGLLDSGCQNLIPYATKLFLEKLPKGASDEDVQRYYKLRSSFRRTYGRCYGAGTRGETYQTPIHFLGIFDTVKTLGNPFRQKWIPGESLNERVRTVRHALALDERRIFFPQMHWERKPHHQDAREV